MTIFECNNSLFVKKRMKIDNICYGTYMVQIGLQNIYGVRITDMALMP